MTEKYTKEMHEEYRHKVDEQAKREEESRRENAEKQSARLAWLADGGAEADFEREWPKLRNEGRRRRVVDADRRAREQMRNSPTSRIQGGPWCTSRITPPSLTRPARASGKH